jgi:hypothetical protein
MSIQEFQIKHTTPTANHGKSEGHGRAVMNAAMNTSAVNVNKGNMG